MPPKLKDLIKHVTSVGLNKEINDPVINDTLKFYKTPKKIKKFNSIKKNMVAVPHVAFMADLLELPETRQGYKYLLTVVDLADNDCDFEPMKNKTSETCINAFKRILQRQYLKQPKVITTDNGNEFKGSFDEWLNERRIRHRRSLPYRHQQLANVENLNLQLGRILNAYMNAHEERKGRVYREWTEILPEVRVQLNQMRHIDVPPYDPANFEDFPIVEFTEDDEEPKFHKGDFVHYSLAYPHNALNNKQDTGKFRAQDKRFSTATKQISKVIVMQDEPKYRYLLKGIRDVMFYEEELMASDATDETKYVKKIWDKRRVGNRVEYRVWFKGELKANSVWLPRAQLLEDGLGKEVRAYDREHADE